MNAYQKFNQLAAQVTREVITELQKGKVLWQQPWGSYGLPQNYGSGRPYEGFNAFYLHYITEKNNFTAPYFLTFKQAQELGGHIGKGQTGTRIVYWKVCDGKGGLNADEQQAEKGEDKNDRRLVPFLWTVFNIDQVAGVDFQLPAVPERSGQQLIAACQQVVESFPSPRPGIRYGADAWYAPALDMVQVPELKRFVSAEAYHATLFHELIHATGHPARLNRFTNGEKADRFGDEAYSKEELVAEMGASFLCAFTGIKKQVFSNSVAYLQGWVSKLEDDKTMLIYAAARAFKAASYILGLKEKEQQEALTEAKAAA